MLGFILILIILTGIWVALILASDLSDVKKNWDKYRCRPTIMPFAGLFGHNAGENFNFCLQNIMGTEFGQALQPVFQVLGSTMNSIMVLLAVANSLRLAFATMMGGVNTIFGNFSERFRLLMSNIQQSAQRIQFLMGRIYGAFFAMIYMSIAGMTALQNFTDTTLFSFLDTFCFDPDTLVQVKHKGYVKVKDVQIGDVFAKTGGVVTSTFQFVADGQPMVSFPNGPVVSTNHYVEHQGQFVRSDQHPDARGIEPWSGGKDKPLICFNTSDHRIPVGDYIFMDYDETEDADQETMNWIDNTLNATHKQEQRPYKYSAVIHPNTKIKMDNGSSKALRDIQLQDKLSTGEVIGIVRKQISMSCTLANGEVVAPGCSVWVSGSTRWDRAGDLVTPLHPQGRGGGPSHPQGRGGRPSHPQGRGGRPYPHMSPQTYISLVVKGTASIETEQGTMIRDYVEVHSPDAEQFYAKSIQSGSLAITE